MKRSSIVLCIVLTGVSILLAKDFWEEPFTEWDEKEVVKLLNESPWAQQMTFTSSASGREAHGGLSGESQLYNIYSVRFFTALPVRQAYVRMFQIMNQYDEMTAQDQEAFNQKFSRALSMDTSDQIIVALEFATNDRQLSMDVERALKQTTADLLRQQAYLISDRLGRVQVKEYFPPSPDGTGAKFIFPRQVNDQPVVSPEDRHVKFELYFPGSDDKVFIQWNVVKMIYNGRLEI